MTVKVLVLKSGEDVIADVQEMMSSKDQVMGYFLNKPCVVKLQTSKPTQDELDPKQPEKQSDVSVSMYPWMPLAREKAIPISTDWVVTMITPVEKIQEMYEKDVLKDDREETNSTSNSDEQSKVGLTD
tara:strand:+ start:300 stop:683 length:384 start_codon:yes stop_codon:yes gene_type:complete